jgi:capsular polysaccharide biosynthesis protein
MNLDEIDDTSEDRPEVKPARPGPNHNLPDLFKRDLRYWLLALLQYWWVILACAAVGAVAFFLFRTFTMPLRYSSSCALVRMEITDQRNSGLPTGYSAVQFNVIFNMIRSRSCLTETMRRLNLKSTHEQMYNVIDIRQAEKNSNYFFITATTAKPQSSADIANTLSEVFVDHYKQFIRTNVKTAFDSSERNRRALQEELLSLQAQLKDIGEANEFSSLSRELATLGQRIAVLEERTLIESTTLEAVRRKRVDLEAQLGVIPTITEIYSERSTARDQKLVDMKLELAALEQQYTDQNPIVDKKRQLVLALEREMAESKNDGDSKVVMGRNPEYTNLRIEFLKSNGEINAAESLLSQYTEKLIQLRVRRDELNLLLPQITQLEEQVDQKKKLLAQQEDLSKEFELFLERQYSDVSILEPAVLPTTPLPRRRGLFLFVGAFLGLMVSVAVALGREALNLTVRSRVDLEDALHIPALGVVPAFSPKRRADFYSELQSIVGNTQEQLQSIAIKPAVIAVAPVRSEEYSEEVMKALYNILGVRDIHFLRIRVAPDNSAGVADFLINDFLYGLSETPPSPNREDELYFKLDDLALLSPPSREKVRELRSHLPDYDVMIWELFDFDMHPQLYTEICDCSDMTIMPMKYAATSKWAVYRILCRLREAGVQKLGGILFGVQNKSYFKVN